MKKRTVDPDMPVGKLTRVEDFLPPPQHFVRPYRTTKVTISLTSSTLDFFKKHAAVNHTKYQRMIRELLDWYALIYKKKVG